MCIIKINIIQLLIILIDIVYSNSQPTVTPSEGIPLQTLFSLITTQPNTLVFLYHTWSNMVEDIQ